MGSMSGGSPSAEVLRAQRGFVRALARELVRDEHAAEELEQETWLRFLERPQGIGQDVRAWLRTVARRLAIDLRRTIARRTDREALAARDESLRSTAEELAEAELSQALVAAVLALDEIYRDTVLARYWRGWGPKRIAAETGTPIETVRSRLLRAHRILRERLENSDAREAWALVALAGAPRPPLAGLGVMFSAGSKALVAVALSVGLLFLALRGLPQPESDSGLRDPQIDRTDVNEESATSTVASTSRRSSERVDPSGSDPGRLRLGGLVVHQAYEPLGLRRAVAADLPLRVFLSSREQGENVVDGVEVRTDAQGKFVVELEDPGQRPLYWQVRAQPDDTYRQLAYTTSLEEMGERVLLRVAHGKLLGRVFGMHDEPLAGVRLQLGQGAEFGPQRTAVSDEEGRFEWTGIRRVARIRARHPRYVEYSWDRPRRAVEGGWEPLVVRMIDAAQMVVTIRTPAGVPVANAHVACSYERSETRTPSPPRRPSKIAQGTTDAKGRLSLAGLPAGRWLKVAVSCGSSRIESRSIIDGRLVFSEGPESTGEPILLTGGVESRFEAQLTAVEVEGHVRYADGRPADGAQIRVMDRGQPERATWKAPSASPDGSFRFVLLEPALLGPLEVRAAHGRAALGSWADLESLSAVPPGGVGRVLLPPAEAFGTTQEIVLNTSLSITGTLFSSDGVPMGTGLRRARLWAQPAGSRRHRFAGNRDAMEGVLGEHGHFEIAGLEEGSYDLLVSRDIGSFYPLESSLHRLEQVRAGTSGVILELPYEEPVRIRVEHGLEADRRFTLLRSRFESASPMPHVAQASSVVSVRGVQPWPPGTRYGFGGASLERGRDGMWVHGHDGGARSGVDLPDLGPGLYAIGVHPLPKDDWFPQATPLLRFEPGTYTIRFEPQRATSLSGKVLNAPASDFVAVQIVDERGRPVPVADEARSTEPRAILETGATGAFRMHLVPVGSFFLRVGTRAQLENGLYSNQVPLEVGLDREIALEVPFRPDQQQD